MVELLATTATFRRGVAVKMLYFMLASADFLLTLWALRLGLTELNPFVASLLGAPAQFFLVKVLASFFVAWLIPSRLLIPGVALLVLVVAWDFKELLLFLH
ncbi:MAG: hypothetical protein HY671_02585 [Chloroflexi bacterium]|nr:hypothetical protein [Chloroflexota bacterium]